MKRYLKWILVLLGVLFVLSILIITLGRGDTIKNRRIAEDLLEYHRRVETHTNLLSSILSLSNLTFGSASLTNLPFRDGEIIEFPVYGVTAVGVFVRRSHNLQVTHLDEFYWTGKTTTNLSEWTLYHGWYWKNHLFGTHKLLTIVETNTPPH